MVVPGSGAGAGAGAGAWCWCLVLPGADWYCCLAKCAMGAADFV